MKKNKLFFCKEIYNKNAVLKAMKDYSKLANFNFSENSKYFFVGISKERPEFKDVIENEFCNYVLSLGKK
jgi:hypothetical protein